MDHEASTTNPIASNYLVRAMLSESTGTGSSEGAIHTETEMGNTSLNVAGLK